MVMNIEETGSRQWLRPDFPVRQCQKLLIIAAQASKDNKEIREWRISKVLLILRTEIPILANDHSSAFLLHGPVTKIAGII
jgi:hypothetical protein